MKKYLILLTCIGLALSACRPRSEVPLLPFGGTPETVSEEPATANTPIPTRPPYAPGELVDYVVQTGDTVPALAKHFNTTSAEIMAANPIIPEDATTLPPGMPMKIPIYYLPLWGSQHQIIPDHAFVNGPSSSSFDARAFVAAHPGWLNNYMDYVGARNRSGAEIVDFVAAQFSVSPRLLLALLEYHANALTDPRRPASPYVLDHESYLHASVYMQLVWAANTLNNGYYGWRTGNLTEFDLPDNRIERIDPWQNAATAALHYYFSRKLAGTEYESAIGPGGLQRVFTDLFGDPWLDSVEHIPVSLQQPELLLPFERGKTWSFTGGPHAGWGDGAPLAAIDFAPAGVQECNPADDWVTAMTGGLIVRSEGGVVEQDLDNDGDTRTGWVLFYLHVSTEDRVKVGTMLNPGDRIGHPSCEGGESTGTHVHIARKYNGEWIPAEGLLAFNLEGWVAQNGSRPYLGTLMKSGLAVRASDTSAGSGITSGK
jgi:LysM repeat protein